MRLINTATLELKEFTKLEVPKYAILSHTWGLDEVTFQEFQHPKPTTRTKSGYQKILKCCEIARKAELLWAWVDTCSIDKTNSAELSEAINSMFKWYRNSSICFAFMSDVDSVEDRQLLLSNFEHSRWFTRGWTLQELIAPFEIVFLDNHWMPFGSKAGQLTAAGHFPALRDIISSVTRIDSKLLEQPPYCNLTAFLGSYSVAEKLSWAAWRVTTRIEDRAYSLLGLFDINMPLLYGEGSKAFIRFQEEIIKEVDDESVFAWVPSNGRWAESAWGWQEDQGYRGILAESPDDFRNSAGIVPFRLQKTSAPATITSRGINIHTQVYGHHRHLFAILQCRRKNQTSSVLAIGIRPVSSDGSFYARRAPMQDLPFRDLVGLGLRTVVLAKKTNPSRVKGHRQWDVVFDIHDIKYEYCLRQIQPHKPTLMDEQCIFSICDSDGSIGIFFQPVEHKRHHIPSFGIALACVKTTTNGQNSLRAASVVEILDDSDVQNTQERNACLSKLIQTARNEAETRRFPHMGICFLNTNSVLITEHSVSQLFDYPLVVVEIKTLWLRNPYHYDEYQNAKEKLELRALCNVGEGFEQSCLKNLKLPESRFLHSRSRESGLRSPPSNSSIAVADEDLIVV
jgi:Heterokaryon incompatibility protein (HET)